MTFTVSESTGENNPNSANSAHVVAETAAIESLLRSMSLDDLEKVLLGAEQVDGENETQKKK
jgi:hypothetical protein